MTRLPTGTISCNNNHNDLTPNRHYQLRIIDSSGGVSLPVTLRTELKVPDAPLELAVVRICPWAIEAVWRAADDGGAPIEMYNIAVHATAASHVGIETRPDRPPPSDAAWMHDTTSDCRYVLKTPPLRCDVWIRVAACNARGVGAAAIVLCKSSGDVPSAPEFVMTEDVSTESVTLAWPTAAADGGSSIHSYAVHAREFDVLSGELSVWRRVWHTSLNDVSRDDSSSTPILRTIVRDLAPSRNYFLSVSACSEMGIGRGSPCVLVQMRPMAPATPAKPVHDDNFDSFSTVRLILECDNPRASGELQEIEVQVQPIDSVEAAVKPEDWRQARCMKVDRAADIADVAARCVMAECAAPQALELNTLDQMLQPGILTDRSADDGTGDGAAQHMLCDVPSLHSNSWYRFRIRARNHLRMYGEWSPSSDPIRTATVVPLQPNAPECLCKKADDATTTTTIGWVVPADSAPSEWYDVQAQIVAGKHISYYSQHLNYCHN